MKKVITLLSLIGSGIIILDSFHVIDSLAAFLIAGLVPGTNIVLAPQQMLDIFVGAFGFMASRLALSAIRAHRTKLLSVERHNTLSPQL